MIGQNKLRLIARIRHKVNGISVVIENISVARICYIASAARTSVYVQGIVCHISVGSFAFYDVESRKIAYFYKFIAMLEGMRAYGCQTIGQGYACKPAAIIERILSYAFYACGQNYACKISAIIERIISYAFYACGQSYACKTAAIIERIISYAFYACGQGYACKTAAIIERIISYACNAFGQGYACKTAAIIERAIQDISARHGNDLQLFGYVEIRICC